MFVKTFLIAAALFLLPAAAFSQAAPVCNPDRDVLAKAAVQKYQEHQRVLALLDNGNVLEIYVSKQGTFSIMVTKADGSMTCVTGTGNSWREARSPQGERPPREDPKQSQKFSD
jgi:hypothetical protein